MAQGTAVPYAPAVSRLCAAAAQNRVEVRTYLWLVFDKTNAREATRRCGCCGPDRCDLGSLVGPTEPALGIRGNLAKLGRSFE